MIAVSEAIGTILLLAISVSLVGLLAVWVNTLPEPQETIEAELASELILENGQYIVQIEHIGGDAIDTSQIEVIIKIDGVTQGRYELFYSTQSIFNDDLWKIGEVWRKNINSMHNWNISIPEVLIEVKDINTDSIIFSEVVQMSGELGRLPDLQISEEDIRFHFKNETLRKGEWVNISVNVYNVGGAGASNVIVRFFDGSRVISQDRKDYRFISSITAGTYQSTWVNWTPANFGIRPINVKVYSAQMEEDFTNNYASKNLEVEPSIPKISGPNLEIEDIIFDPEVPTHGDMVTVTVLVKNVGDEEVPAGSMIFLTLEDEEGYWLTKDVIFYFNTTTTKNITQFENLQPSFSYGSQTTYGGKTKIKAQITPVIIGAEDTRSDDNYMDKYLQILPTILLVDDDGYFETYTREDASSYMDAALQLAVGSGQFDIVTVRGEDGPKFDSGDKQLKDYDIVIWMTGYQTKNTITANDQDTIIEYLENGGKLWVIGQNILEDIRVRDFLPMGAVNSFTRNYFGVDSYEVTGTPDFLYGIPGENLTEGMVLNLSNIVKSKDRGVNLSLRQSKINQSIDGILGNDEFFGQNGNMSLKYYNQTENYTYKVVFFGWEFASIIDMINRNNLTIQILKWFGWELEIGTDLAIASKGFSDEAPEFMDWITISATVRNNGPRDITRVRVDFFVINQDGREERIPYYSDFDDYGDNPRFIHLYGGGYEKLVQKKWLATAVGRHTFRVVVDLEDEIDEVSEENNDDFYSPLFVTQLYIGYTILVVDDDNSSNNGGIQPNATQEISDAIDELGYQYVVHTVPGAPIPEYGPNITVMKHYNAVIWCTGYADVNTLMASDLENLTYYFNRDFPEANYLGKTKMNAWIVGQGILDDVGGAGLDVATDPASFLYKYLKVDSYTTVGIKLPSMLEGVAGDNITHGINYPTIDSPVDMGDIITPTSEGTGIFWQNPVAKKYNAVRYNSTTHHMVFTPWVFSLIDDTSTAHLVDESYKGELCYLILRWFSYPDERFELKISDIDVELSNRNPVLGNAYIIHANIFNLGINDTNAVVRFLDVNTVIDTRSIFVPSGGNSTTEVIWTPLYAGYRNLIVSIDPDNDIGEVFDILNNNASIKNQIVYFFFDDLENGTSNWKHQSTILLINGESPLDYMDNPVFSDVNSTWNSSESNGYSLNYTEYHSYSSSYFTYEPIGYPKQLALDIVMALDTSGSMSGSKIGDLRNAAKNFISHPMLDARDRMAIITYRQEGPYLEQNFTDCDTDGKTALTDIVDGLNANAWTPLWDSIGMAVEQLENFGSTRIPVVIAMTDGEDMGNEGREDGSEEYCPWHEWRDKGLHLQYRNRGPAAGDDVFVYDGGSTGNPGSRTNWDWYDLNDEWRYGLLNISDITIYTVGLGLRHDNHSADSSWRFPDGWMGSYAAYEDEQNSWTGNYNVSTFDESGTPEFNLWRVANTSKGGKYFYADDSSKLNNIFQTIATTIVSQTTVSRALDNDVDDEDNRGRGSTAGARGRSRPQIFFDGLETGNFNGGPWSVGAGWSVETNYQRSGTYYAQARGDYRDSSMALSTDLDLSKYEDVKLIFWHYTYDVENRDDMYIDISLNSGSTWTEIKHWRGGDIEDTNYNKGVISLKAYDGQSKFRFRFRFEMDSSWEYWLIDDIEIRGNTTGGGGGGGGVIDPHTYIPGDRNLTTYTFSLVNVTDAKLSFYHKYNLRLGLNGVVVMVGTTNNSGTNWSYEYVRPTQPYTNNFLLSMTRYDDYGNDMRWCWNGISGNGKYTWDYVEVDLSNWTGRDMVRIRVAFLWAGPGIGGGYLIDDFKVVVSRNETIPLTNNSVDQWNLTDQHAHSGNHCWWNRNIDTGNLSGGLDNSLLTRPIDLTNARNATLSVYFKFNINEAGGRPPDGFRVELSSDNGVTWKAINMGVRAAWGVSGNDSDAGDGVPGDGKSYTGLDVYGDDTDNDGWVEANTLTRLNTDITGWSGNVIILRFRVVTASDNNPFFGKVHCEDSNVGYKGFMVDDVIIYGFSLLG